MVIMASILVEQSPIILQLPSTLNLTDEAFFNLCQQNRDYRLERTAQGELVIMPPTGSETGNRNARLIQQLANWADADGSGIIFDSSTGFKLPSGAERSPDAAWMSLEKWQRFSPEQKSRYVPICPDFVVEMRSPSDALLPLQRKLQEYISNGAQLGWLIDRQQRNVYVYCPDQPMECLAQPQDVGAEPVLPGFRLKMQSIW